MEQSYYDTYQVDSSMLQERKRYFIVGDRPVYTSPNSKDGSFEIKAYDWTTGNFVSAIEYLSKIFFSRADEVEEVSDGEFRNKVALLRSKL